MASSCSSSPASAAGVIKGKVTQTMNAGRYTYVAVDDGSGEKWAAAPTFEVKTGDQVEVQGGMPMKSFHSKSLNRTFSTILFTDHIVNVTKTPEAASASDKPAVCSRSTVSPSGISKIAPPEGGKTIADVIAQRAQLAGKPVTVRGKVMKYSSAIMGKNWLHLQDGSVPDGSADVAVTTDAVTSIGEIVTVTGVVVVDKDFGYGYRYDVLIEGATVKK